jgi:hypothetical protein
MELTQEQARHLMTTTLGLGQPLGRAAEKADVLAAIRRLGALAVLLHGCDGASAPGREARKSRIVRRIWRSSGVATSRTRRRISASHNRWFSAPQILNGLRSATCDRLQRSKAF